MINSDRSATPPIVLSIAGSDPSGGAGIQADLKTAAALGVYGAAALTSLTAQNTRGVTGIHAVPADFVTAQCQAVLDDLPVGAIKIGMLASAEIAAAVSDVLDQHPDISVVLDPVMVATSGDRLVTADVTAVIADRMLPRATVITPNLPEAGTLLGRPAPRTVEEMITTATELCALGARAALVKGGHLDDDHPDHDQHDHDQQGLDHHEDHDRSDGRTPGRQVVDILADESGIRHYQDAWIDTPNTHGTGCTLSTAIACGLAGGLELPAAVGQARDYLTGALASGAGQRIGGGSGPVDHLWRQR